MIIVMIIVMIVVIIIITQIPNTQKKVLRDFRGLVSVCSSSLRVSTFCKGGCSGNRM